jgi:EAL domain-containing protein (putative c-di-GMP-specific phosphodiesterase class I)
MLFESDAGRRMGTARTARALACATRSPRGATDGFLYIAERVDLVQEIDAWVIQQAIRAASNDSESAGSVPLSVNLSGRSIGEPRLLELIEHELAASKAPPQRLSFEITETAAVRHITHARRFSERLAELGCRLALDDFGAGFGSFFYLKHLPFDYLKIDGEFVRNCRSSKTDRLVIEAVVKIAQGLGKSTVAEHVGDDETVRLLAPRRRLRTGLPPRSPRPAGSSLR